MERYDARAHGALDARPRGARVVPGGREGRGTSNGGVWIDVSHLGADVGRAELPGHGEALPGLRPRPRPRPGGGGPDHPLHDGRRRRSTARAAPRSRGCSPRARTRAACTAPTASVATASPSRPCSAASRATHGRLVAGRRDRGAPARGGAAARARIHGAARRRRRRAHLRAAAELRDLMWEQRRARARRRRARAALGEIERLGRRAAASACPAEPRSTWRGRTG